MFYQGGFSKNIYGECILLTCECPIIDGLNEILDGSVVTATFDHVQEVIIIAVLAHFVAPRLVIPSCWVMVNVTQLVHE